MAVTINGTTGIAGVDGSASTPAVQGTDTNTGIFFPAADTIAFGEGGAEVMRINSSGNVGIGTTSPQGPLEVVGVSWFTRNNKSTSLNPDYGSAGTHALITTPTSMALAFATNGDNERMRIDSSGNLGLGSTSPSTFDDANTGGRNFVIQSTGIGRGIMTFASQCTGGTDEVLGVVNYIDSDSTNTNYRGARILGMRGSDANSAYLRFDTANSAAGTERARITSDGILRVGMQNYAAQPSSTNYGVAINNTNTGSRFYGQGTGTETQIEFGNTNGARGSIQTNSTNTLYNTTSDYRLKENVVPMVNALATVSALKPCTYTWKVDGSAGQGFIAHELAEVVPDCVTGEKDAVDEDGNIKPQFVDTSFLVATLTAAIQELKAITDAQATRIETLEAQNAAFEARLAALEAK